MKCLHLSRITAICCLGLLAACGGDGDTGGPAAPVAPSPAPTPSPSPTPTPSPTVSPFPAAAFQVFQAPLYNAEFATFGKGWVNEGPPNQTPAKVTPENDLKLTFDAATNLYRAEADVVGTGYLYQVAKIDPAGEATPVAVADSLSAAQGQQPDLYIRPGSSTEAFRYLALIQPWDTNLLDPSLMQFFFGTFGVAQPTKPGDVPGTGIARYQGVLIGHFDGDAGVVSLWGDVALDIDFANLAGSGSLIGKFGCFMGCIYPDITYTLSPGAKTGANTFAGTIAGKDAPSAGTYRAILAGPNAAEVLLEVAFPAYNFETKKWATYSGIIMAKKAS